MAQIDELKKGFFEVFEDYLRLRRENDDLQSRLQSSKLKLLQSNLEISRKEYSLKYILGVIVKAREYINSNCRSVEKARECLNHFYNDNSSSRVNPANSAKVAVSSYISSSLTNPTKKQHNSQRPPIEFKCSKQSSLTKRQSRSKNVEKTKFSSINIYNDNIRGLNSKKQSLEQILDEQDIHIACIEEVNTKKPPKFKNYCQFNKLSKVRMHGVTILVHNSLKPHVIRIPDESELECVHIRLENSSPALNVIALYLDVESRSTVEQIDKIWSLLKTKVDSIIERGEACVIMGDWNRPMYDDTKTSHGKTLLTDWLNEDKVLLINDRDKSPTRINPTGGGASVLDLCVASHNISKNITSFKVDTNKEATPFSIINRNGNFEKRFSDHLAIIATIKLPCQYPSFNNKKPIINYNNKEGWDLYKEISNSYADHINHLIDTIEDVSELERNIQQVDTEIQIESFGITWVNEGKMKLKKNKKKSHRDLKELFNKQHEDLESLLENGFLGKDLNRKIFKMKTFIQGSKVGNKEAMAINDPSTGELIVNKNQIKDVSLMHNVKILTKNPPREEDLEYIESMKAKHNDVMSKQLSDPKPWELNESTFKKVLNKIKEKNKNLYKLFIKSGDLYKKAIFLYMKRLIKEEKVPYSFKETSLTQIWKGKGSPLDLNQMRFIHMRGWRSKLLEALVTENMKLDIVSSTPPIQLGGMPGAMSVEHLVVLKTWMKTIEANRKSGIFQCFDMSKFFDTESLLDCMNVLNSVANISHKSYRIWYKLNEDTLISVNTSVGESKQALITDSIGQGSVGAALVSSLNIGHAIKEAFKYNYTASIGNVLLHALIFQDDISKMNDTIAQAKESCQIIDETLKKKLLRVNYDKSKYIIFGNKNFKAKVIDELAKDPMKMSDTPLLQSVMEKYLGDIIHEDGCKKSISETIKERTRKLWSKTEEIIQLADNPWMNGLGGSLSGIKLFESMIIPALLHNCESWIGITDQHIKELQSFQEKFIRRLFRLPLSTPKAILAYDTGMQPMKWRIAYRKLNFVRKVMTKPDNSITKRVICQEVVSNIHGLGYESTRLCQELGLPNVLNISLSKADIKAAVKWKVEEEVEHKMTESKKARDRINKPSYLRKMTLPLSRIFIRYRARSISGVKVNAKKSHEDLSCRFCSGNAEESQDHLQECSGTEFERRGLDLSRDWGMVNFWKRMMKKLAAVS